ncbi:GDSL-type esterase/lipase family protein [Pradoshia sp.]
MKKWWMSAFLLTIGLAVSVLLLIGFLQAASAVLKTNELSGAKYEKEHEALETKDEKKLSIVALGDSLTRGIGDDSGQGYVKRLTRALTEEYNQDISLANLSISGAKTDDLAALLETSGAQHAISKADIILMTIGGNDLFPGADALTAENLAEYAPDTAAFETNSRIILDSLREQNPDAPIYWISLYNPFEDLTILGDTSQFVIDWNYQLQMLASQYESLVIIPVFDLFQGQVKEFLYTDHFHPNAKGYEAIAERLTQAIVSQQQLREE